VVVLVLTVVALSVVAAVVETALVICTVVVVSGVEGVVVSVVTVEPGAVEGGRGSEMLASIGQHVSGSPGWPFIRGGGLEAGNGSQ